MERSKIFVNDKEQSIYETIMKNMNVRTLKLARMLYGIERTGRHDGIPIGTPIAPIYHVQAHHLLSTPENKAALIELLRD